MNLLLEVRLNGETIKVELAASDPEALDVSFDAEDASLYSEVTAAMGYLSGLDGKMVAPETATIADWALVLGKMAEGDMRLLSGRLPGSLLSDTMTNPGGEDE